MRLSSFVISGFVKLRSGWRYTFGGIYADLDSEAVSPLAPLLAAQDPANALSVPIAFLGSMDTYLQEIHSIPNAFMASSAPGHPLWLIAAQDAVNWCRARVWDVEAPLPDPGTSFHLSTTSRPKN